MSESQAVSIFRR